MRKFSVAASHDLTEIWDQLTEHWFARGTNPRSRHVISGATAAMHLTAHLVCGYIGNPYAILKPTMTLQRLADRLRRETDPVVECFHSRTTIDTFGNPGAPVADARWLLALWTLVMDMVTSTRAGTLIEVSVGACGGGYEFEVGHDDRARDSTADGAGYLAESLTGRWLAAICPDWTIELPHCPTGGLAVQLNIPAAAARRAA